MDAIDLSLLLTAAAAAGWVDAVVGGGGLLLIPAMLIGAPQLPLATVLGTNKLTAIAGTSSAAITFSRRTKIDWRVAAPASAAAIATAGAGAWFAGSIPGSVFRPIVLAVLIGVALFVTFRPAMGQVAEPHKRTPHRALIAVVACGGVMAVCNIVGAQLGARTALRRGSAFVRIVLLVVVTALVIKLGYELFYR